MLKKGRKSQKKGAAEAMLWKASPTPTSHKELQYETSGGGWQAAGGSQDAPSQTR